MRVAVIPARGGSKRIPRKNIRPFCGRPMVVWSIAAALESGCFDTVLVSTDDEEIAETARAEGAEVPFMRPAELSDDYTHTVPVIRHAMNWLIAQRGTPEAVCCIYATAPFVDSEDLRLGLRTLLEGDAAYVFSATSYDFAIQRAIRILPSGRVEMFQPEHALTRSQDLEEAYHDAGQFYWGRPDSWCSDRAIMGPDSAAILIPRCRVQDIDTFEDWERAEALFRLRRNPAD